MVRAKDKNRAKSTRSDSPIWSMLNQQRYRNASISTVKTAVLEDAINLVKPVPGALAPEPIVRRYRQQLTEVPAVDCAVEYRVEHQLETFSEVGFILADNYVEAGRGKNFSGDSSGRCLYLLVDGRLAEVRRTGFWSDHLPDGGDRWDASLAITSIEDAVAEFSLDEILERLDDFLRADARRSGERSTRDLADRIKQHTNRGPTRRLAKGDKQVERWSPSSAHELVLAARSSAKKVSTIFGRKLPTGWWVFTTVGQTPKTEKMPPMAARLADALVLLMGADWWRFEPVELNPEIQRELLAFLKRERFAASESKDAKRAERIRIWESFCFAAEE